MSAIIITDARFDLGRLVITPNAMEKLSETEVASAVARHAAGDWGKLDPEDWQANETALVCRSRLFSQYYTAEQVKFWIITEWDRSCTTVLMPEDY